MQKKVTSIITRAKAGIEETMKNRHLNHDPSWPPHSILCDCNKCMKIEFKHIKEQRLARQKAKQKVTQ